MFEAPGSIPSTGRKQKIKQKEEEGGDRWSEQ
jgi:hypothetical protein